MTPRGGAVRRTADCGPDREASARRPTRARPAPPRAGRIAVLLTTTFLAVTSAGAGFAAAATADGTGGGAPRRLAVAVTTDPATRSVAATPGTPAILADGHADIAPRVVGGRLRLQVREDTQDPPATHDLDAAALHVRDAARTALPEDPAFGFLGRPGARVWLLPEVQAAGIVWPGWSTEDRELARRASGPLTWTLRSVRAADGGRAPGRFVLFASDAFGAPTRIFDGGRALPQSTRVPVGTHAHGSWAFTAPGAYALDLEMSATLRDGALARDRRTLRIVVGGRDPRAVLRAGAADPGDGTPVLLVLLPVGAAIVLVGGTTVVLLRRRGSAS
jgi:surface-anchored protein